jgi:hypothetical protein
MAETIATIASVLVSVGACTGYLSRRIERVEDRVERLSEAYLRHPEHHAR